MMFTTLLSLFYTFLTVFVKSDTTYCYNEDSCEDEDISTTVADCYGYYGCEGSNLTSTYAYNFGAYSNYEGDCDDNYLWGYGMLANYYSDISTYALYSYGYLSSYEATIKPIGSSLYAYFYGYYSGYHANILCYSGDICRVYCGASYGCADLDFYCYSGAYCFYDCANDTDYCPTLYSGVASQVEYITGLSEYEEKEKLIIYDSLTDEQIFSHYKIDVEMSQIKKKTENIEHLIHSLNRSEGIKSGFADDFQMPIIKVNSMNQHMNRLISKKNNNNNNNNRSNNKWQNYGKAMLIDGGFLALLFIVYKCVSFIMMKNKTETKNVFVSENTPLITKQQQQQQIAVA